MFANNFLKAARSIFLISLALPAVGQTPATKPVSEDISAIVSTNADIFLKSAPQAAGLSIGIFKDGKTSAFNYGTIEKGKKIPPSADTLYQIASISKTFTGTLLAQAVLEKKVKFDDDVRKYLDGDYPNLEYQGHFIQLGQLVNHNSGLPFNLPDIPETRPPFTAPVSPATQEILIHYSRKDFLRIWQEGNLPGYVSMCMTFPELHMAIVFLANQDDPASSHALSVMVEAIAKSLDARSAPLF